MNKAMNKEDIKKPTTRVKKTITKQLIMDYINTFKKEKYTDEEINQFYLTARENNLNPLKREIHSFLYIKHEKDDYGQPVEVRNHRIVTGYEVYIKRATQNKDLDGWSVTTGYNETKQDYYAEIIIHRKNWKVPFSWRVYLKEYYINNTFWNKKKFTMLKKVVIAQGFRLSFPEQLEGLPYTHEEILEDNYDFQTVKDSIDDKTDNNDSENKSQSLSLVERIKENSSQLCPPVKLKGNEIFNPDKSKEEVLSKIRPYHKKLQDKDKEYFIKLKNRRKKYTKQEYDTDLKRIDQFISNINNKKPTPKSRKGKTSKVTVVK